MRGVRAIGLIAAALWIAAPSVAAADVYDDNPATVSRGPGELYVFARAADGTTLERHRIGATWSDWASIGGYASSGPAAIAYHSAIYVFVRGIDGGIYQRVLGSDGRWGDWIALGGYSLSAPGVTVRRGSRDLIDLVVRGSDNALWHRAFVPGTGWTQPATIGGNLTSAPAVNSQSPELLNIWARGTDGAVYQRSWNGSAWVDWFSIGGGIEGAPASVSRAENFINVYVRGGNRVLFARSWTASGWGDWFVLDPRPIDSAPGAGADGPDHEWVVARSGANVLLKEWGGTAGWGAWQDLGPVAVPPPPPAPAPAPPPPADRDLNLETGVACTPAGGRVRVRITVRKPKSGPKARVVRIVFYTKGRGRAVRVDRKSPFVVRMKVNRSAGSKGRVYARVYYKRSARGKTHRKTVSRRYTVCR
jgi:hypothetical protein